MAYDLDPKNLAVFCGSLRNVSSAEVVLFMNAPVSQRALEITRRYDVNVQVFDVQGLPHDMQSFHPSTSRWKLIYDFMAPDQTRRRYRRVWMVDARDTFFQEDPFEMLPLDKEALYVFTGVESVLIRDDGWNRGWIKDCFSDDIYRLVADKHIICSGVSMGSVDAVLRYLDLMNDVVTGQRRSEISKNSRFPHCERNGVDQGVHNVLVYTAGLPNLRVFDQSRGPVANMQARKAIVKGIEVRNEAGERVAVVHQYDRNAVLQKNLFRRFVYWTNTDDLSEEWKLEKACSSFSYVMDKDLLKGNCDLSASGGAASASTCCKICKDTSACKSFVYYSGMCFLKSCKTQTGALNGVNLVGAVTGVTLSRK